MFKKLLTLSLSLFLLSSLTLSAFAFDRETASVYIGTNAGHGTGVLISPTKVLTVKHVITAVEDVTKFMVTTKEGRGVKVKSAQISQTLDVGVLTLEEPIEDIEPAVVTCDVPAIGEELTYVGNPAYLQWLVVPLRVVGFDDERVLTVGLVLGGASGSPVYNSDDEVIGLVSQGLDIRIPGFEGIPTGLNNFVSSSAFCNNMEELTS
jgi:S1-C subfamily serine protease